jgi:hypothetical protein
MSLPDVLSGAIGDEQVATRIPLGGDDVLVVTPSRTLVYRAEGLLSGETVEEYPHDAERLAVSSGRRKSKVTFSYGLDGDETLAIPSGRLDDVIHPILLGVLSARGVTAPDESIVRAFRFSELTLVVTDQRLVKHVGAAVWDEEFEAFPYADLTDLYFEEGTVATTVVIQHSGRSERFKTPNESARSVRETLVEAVCAFHDVDRLEAFRRAVAVDTEDETGVADDATSPTDFGVGPDPLSASPAADAADTIDEPDEGDAAAPPTTNAAADVGVSRGDPAPHVETNADASDADEESPTNRSDADDFEDAFERATVEDDSLAEAVADLRRTVEAQSAAIDRQADLIEQLIEELRQGR